MATKILMPALSPTMSEGSLTKWLINVGDKIKAGDIVAEIETDKATMEVESSDDGIVTQLLIKEGASGVAVSNKMLEKYIIALHLLFTDPAAWFWRRVQ